MCLLFRSPISRFLALAVFALALTGCSSEDTTGTELSNGAASGGESIDNSPFPEGGGGEETGELPCAANCTLKQCGPDGCGGICGICPQDEYCSEKGECFANACEPNCEGKPCGDDGCGDVCGLCSIGSTCTDAGLCELDCVPNCTGKDCGDNGCGDVCGTCDLGDVCTDTGICETPCVPNCTGKTCGDDACGGVCGPCGAGEICGESGSCESVCSPSCGGKNCGPDGCGDTCGICGEAQSCSNQGVCEDVCFPNCEEKTCGDNGCGGSCGTCAGDQICSPKGECIGDCTPSCVGKECGSNGCGGICGICDPEESCSNAGVCLQDCVPDCAGKECGLNGCGGICGICDPGFTCTIDNTCLGGCIPDCAGKECGNNGCGGSCGECPANLTCGIDGACSQPTADGCVESSIAGCNGCACEACVCELDSFCCEFAWDIACVGLCDSDCGGNCLGETGGETGEETGGQTGGGNGECCGESDIPGCLDPTCEACVCGLDAFCCDSSWDSLCVLAANDVCSAECGCGGGGETEGGGCAAGEVPDCLGGCTFESWIGDGICDDELNCDLFGFDAGDCGGTTTTGGGNDDCCAESDLPGCTDGTCEACVCGTDPFCCDSGWDSLCVGVANDICAAECGCGGGGTTGGGTGACCTESDLPGCTDGTCEACVCGQDPFCCDSGWDSLCAGIASDICAAECGCGGTTGGGPTGGGTGICCETSEFPGCTDATCEACVCGTDPFCCDSGWDSICAGAASEICAAECGCGGGGTTGGGGGCPAGEILDCVGGCTFESWIGDGICDAALDCEDFAFDQGDCGGTTTTGGGGEGSCAGKCGVYDIAALCQCDELCSQYGDCCPDYDALCLGGGGTTGGGTGGGADCCENNGTPGCSDPGCQTCVCASDSFCCNTSWDSLCASIATDACALSCSCAGGGTTGGGTTGGGNDPNSCVGNCGDQAPNGCYCDGLCVNYGDCCIDACSACGYCG